MNVPNIKIDKTADQVHLELMWRRITDQSINLGGVRGLLNNPPNDAGWLEFAWALLGLLEWLESQAFPTKDLKTLLKLDEKEIQPESRNDFHTVLHIHPRQKPSQLLESERKNSGPKGPAGIF